MGCPWGEGGAGEGRVADRAGEQAEFSGGVLHVERRKQVGNFPVICFGLTICFGLAIAGK